MGLGGHSLRQDKPFFRAFISGFGFYLQMSLQVADCYRGRFSAGLHTMVNDRRGCLDCRSAIGVETKRRSLAAAHARVRASTTIF